MKQLTTALLTTLLLLSAFKRFGNSAGESIFRRGIHRIWVDARTPSAARLAWAWLNAHTFSRSSELMFQTYYQANIYKDTYFEPAISYIPTPGGSPSFESAWALTMRIIVLF